MGRRGAFADLWECDRFLGTLEKEQIDEDDARRMLAPLDFSDVPVKALKAPKQVRPEERAAHEAAGHTPYRSWCSACVAGAGAGERRPSVKPEEVERLKPVLVLDYAYLNDRTDDGSSISSALLLVTKDTVDGWVSSRMVPQKGVDALAV